MVTKRTAAGATLLVGILAFFLTQTRLPAIFTKLPNLGIGASARERATFDLLVHPDQMPDSLAWIAHALNLWDANAVGMFFAVLLGGAVSAAVVPEGGLRAALQRGGPAGAGIGAGLGLPLFMCSACSAPVSMGFYRSGAKLETALGIIFGSALFNPVGLLATFLLMPVSMGVARVGFGLAAVFVLVPLVARSHAGATIDIDAAAPEPGRRVLPPAEPGDDTWTAAVTATLRSWWWNTSEVAIRLVPGMFIAGFFVGGILMLAPPQRLSDLAGAGLGAVVVAALIGTFLQLPTLFEIPLVLGALALGLDPAPATALLVTAPSVGIITFVVVRRELGWRVPARLLAATFAGGSAAGALAHLL